MGDILSGLEVFGLKNLDRMDVYGDENAEKPQKESRKTEPVKPLETDTIFEKGYECPCCDHQFREKTVRTGKMRMISQDIDLRPRYDVGDTLKYGVVVCPLCGYAALVRSFMHLSPAQSKIIHEKVSQSFTGINLEAETYSYDDAIARHKLALACAVLKRSEVSERAYLCLMIAWLLRVKAEQFKVSSEETRLKREAMKEEEQALLAKAADGLKEAFTREHFPMCGLDESTATYLVAALSFETGKYDEAGIWVSKILTNRTVNNRIKDKARTLKDTINEMKGQK